ncbi:MAG: glycosyltransferase [Tannerella sp.]|jgi:glycosyltransferase involved in cell wall biosynthesis|nr:glycosyltransferase [Tannerella sp.]
MKHAENTPLVSVIIPVYNSSEFLEETLLSVLSSAWPNMEIVIVDDGSTDDSPAIAARYAAKYDSIRFLQQANAGAAAARNRAIAAARGEYILPVDADNLISPDYIKEAVKTLKENPQVKVVSCEVEFFGLKTGRIKYPPFSYRLLARKNMIDNCAMYRKKDWDEIEGGYCECKEISGREDWDLWISMFKTGGEFVRLPFVGLLYRERKNSYRKTTRNLKRSLVNLINSRHREFLYEQLGGKLHYHRTWSRLINTCCGWIHARKTVVDPSFKSLSTFMLGLPSIFREQGETMFQGRNELRLFHWEGYELAVKSYKRPHALNAVIYGFLRASKAERAYCHALRLLAAGVGTPAPVGFVTCRRYFLFADSFSVTLRSTCPYTYRDFAAHTFVRRNEILEAIARTTARMHENGILHRDYSAGNILFDDASGAIAVEIVDLNRMSFEKTGLKKGCRNFERLPATDDMIAVMATCYAKERGFDPETCIAGMKAAIMHGGKS